MFGDPARRMSATLGNPTYLGAYSMVNAVIGAALVVQSFGRSAGHGLSWVRGLWGGMVLVNLWALWLSGSRGALVGLGAAGLVFAAYVAWGRMQGRAPGGGRRPGRGRNRGRSPGGRKNDDDSRPGPRVGLHVEQAFGHRADRSASGRIAFTVAGLRGFPDRAALGWGPENFVVVWGRYGGADVEPVTSSPTTPTTSWSKS